MKRINLFFALLSLQTGLLFSQNDENLYDQTLEFMEELLIDEEKENDSEAITENLNYLLENKVNLNNSDINDLLRLPFISEREVHAIVRHRREFGEILSFYELKNIPELDMQTIELMLPFITIDSIPVFSLKNIFRYNKSQFFARYDRVLQDKNGYINHATAPNKKYIGDPDHYYVKYLFQCSDKISLGFTAEKDAGEPAWNAQNKGFDFYSFHIQFSNIDFLKRVVIGDYRASFGQGLVMGTASIIGKSNSVLNISQRNRGIQKYSSTGEYGYLRGIGTTVRLLDGLDLSFLYSQNKIDANISEYGLVTSFKTDGLHRMEREIEKKRNLSEKVMGGNLNYRKENFSVGGTFIKYQYGNILQPDEKPYNLYKIQKTDNHWNGSLDYSLRLHGISLFGELACDKNGGAAMLNGLNLYPASRVGLLLLHRYYTPDYQANYANGFGENSRIENEQGFYVGAEFKPVKRFKISAYADVYYFPWLKYNLNKPTSGYDFLTYTTFNPSRNTSMYLKHKYKTKEKYYSGNKSIIFYETNTLRYGIRIKIGKHIDSHTILDGNSYSDEYRGKSYGWLASQDFSCDFIANILNISFRYAYFHTPTYENRIYIYEKDVLYTFSIPAYYGIGHRIFFNLRFQPHPNLCCYLKYATYIYSDGRETISSGLEEVKGNKLSNIRCLVRYKF